jgi:hypothetical protein
MAASDLAVSQSLDLPEQEISKLSNQLKGMSQALKSENAMKNTPGQGTGTAESLKALEDSQYWFSKGNWLGAIRELKRYERGTNTHLPKNLLQYHYLYGKSEASLGNYASAITHFKAFLSDSSKISGRDMEKTNDVLASVIECLLKEKSPSKGLELKQNISAILLSEEGTDSAFEANFLAGRLAVIDQSPDLAMDWLNQAANSKSKATTTRGLFYKALLAISQDQSDKAYEILLNAEALSGSSEISTVHDQVLLALGRVEFYRKHYKESLSWLEKIGPKSSEFQSALRESVHAATSALEFSKALKLADTFLSTFPESQYFGEVDLYKSYLILQSSQNGADSKFYEQRIKTLEALAIELKEATLGKERITQTQLTAVLAKVKSIGTAGPLAEKGQDLFTKVNYLEDRANFIKSSVIEQYDWLASHPFSTIFPDDTIRGTELNQKCEALAEVATRLAALSHYVFESELTPADKEALNRSAKRREYIESESAKFQRNFEPIGPWVRGQSQIESLKEIRVLSLEQLAAHNSLPKASDQTEILSLKSSIENRVSDLSLKAQRNTAESLAFLSPYLSLESFLLQYSLAMSYEMSRIRPYLTLSGDFTTRELKKSLSSLWISWFQVSEELYKDVVGNQNKLQTSLRRQLIELEENSMLAADGAAQAATLRSDLELALGKSGSLLTSHFSNEISSRLSETHEWIAESKMKKLEELQKEHVKVRSQAELERQKIAEDYLDTNQSGVQK